MLQSIVFSKELFTPRKVLNWLLRHGYKHSKLDVETNTIRARQETPKKNKRYYSKVIENGIVFVFME
jgi:hypothetical protein